MCWTPIYQTSNKLEHHFSNIERTLRVRDFTQSTLSTTKYGKLFCTWYCRFAKIFGAFSKVRKKCIRKNSRMYVLAHFMHLHQNQKIWLLKLLLFTYNNFHCECKKTFCKESHFIFLFKILRTLLSYLWHNCKIHLDMMICTYLHLWIS